VGLSIHEKSADAVGGESELRDPENILLYFEELCRLSTPVQLWVDPEAWIPIGLKVEEVDEASRSFSAALQRALPGDLSPKRVLELAFPLGGGRFLAAVHFRERNGYLKAIFTLPEAIRFGERRELVRARFGPREKARVTILENLDQGCGATGSLLNLSLSGLCMRVDRVMAAHDEHSSTVAPSLFTPGTHLALVRIQDLPRVPMIECTGLTCHTERCAVGTTLGMRLEGLNGQEQGYLAEILARRLPTFARRFPVRHRRSEDLLIDPTSKVSEDEEDWEEDSETERETASLEEGAPGREGEGVDKHARLLQIRKSGKRILLVMHDDLDRAILAGILQVDGFRRVQEARNFAEALACFRAGEVDLVILDQQIGIHPAPRFLERLRAQGYCQDTPVVLATDQADIRTTIMAKAMRISRLATKPIDYDGALRDVLYGLLGIVG